MSSVSERTAVERGGREESAARGGLECQGFTSRWFYVYLVRGHNEPTLPYRIKRQRAVAYGNVEREIAEIYEDIEHYSAMGHEVADVTWRHKAYLVFILEDEAQVINNVVFERHSPEGPNNSIVCGRTIDRLGGGNGPSAFYCANLMLSLHGEDVPEHVAEVFTVSIQHEARSGHRERRGHTDAGTNLGPPKT